MEKTYSISHLPQFLIIGRRGENCFRRFVFDMSAWLSEYPEGVCSAVFERPDGMLYPVTVTTEDGKMTWLPDSADLSVDGSGKLELRISENDVLGKSMVIKTVTRPALGVAGSAPEAPEPDWVQTVAENAQSAENAREAIESMGVSVSPLPNGASPTVTKTVTDGSVTLSFGIPAGSKGDKGTDGKSAYSSAVSGGYSGTEQQFFSDLASVYGKYEKPGDGIPKTDLASDVQASLGRADTALQSHQSLSEYRTASAQDAMDAVKLTEPAANLTVGSYLRIASIDSDGHAVLETVAPGSLPGVHCIDRSQTGASITIPLNTTVVTSSSASAINVTLVAPDATADPLPEAIWGLIFLAGSGSPLNISVSDDSYKVVWNETPSFTSGTFYEVIFRCLWITDLGDTVIEAVCSEVATS